MKKIIWLPVFVATIMITLTSISTKVQAQGCSDASSDEGVKISGYIQPQWDMNFGKNENTNTFKFNRARIGFLGSIPYDVSYYFFLETSAFKDEKPYLLDAFVSYNRFEWATLSVGQFKSPFGLELNTPCHSLHTIDRSIVVSQLASPDRDLGLMLLGGTKESFVNYRLAIMNGTGRGVIDENKGKDLIGRLILKPLDFINLGVSAKYGTSPSAAGLEKEDAKLILGGELEITQGNFLMQAEYIQADFSGSYTTGGGCGAPLEVHQGSVRKSGVFAQAMYMTKWNLQPVIKYEYWDPDLDRDRTSELGNETVEAYTFDQTMHGYQQSITFGLNYFLNDWTRLQVNYRYCAEEKEFSNDALMIQAQVKF